MASSIEQILQQYGLGTPTPEGSVAAENLGAQSTPPPGAAPTDAALGQDPMDNLRQAISYARQLAAQAKSSIHAGAQVAAQAPGVMGTVGQAAAQATAPEPAPSAPPALDAPTIAGLIRHHESNDNYTAINHDNPGNTASGAYQYTDPTWAGYGGYHSAALAPRAIQDQRAQADIAASLNKYGGDAFKAIAHHYLPAAASNPATWSQPYKLPNGHTVAPVADYVRATVANTPLQGQLDAYLRHYTG